MATTTHTTPTAAIRTRFGAAALAAAFVKPPPLPWRNGPRPVGDLATAANPTPIGALQKHLTDLSAVRSQMDEALIEMPDGPDHDALHERVRPKPV